jgi:hypothetical protein
VFAADYLHPFLSKERTEPALQASGLKDCRMREMAVAVDFHPRLVRSPEEQAFAALKRLRPMAAPSRQAQQTGELPPLCLQAERFASTAGLAAWVCRYRDRESAVLAADPDRSALCPHLAKCWGLRQLKRGNHWI